MAQTPKRSRKRKQHVGHKAAHHVLSPIGLIVAVILILGSFVGTVFLTSPALLSGGLASVVSARLVSLTNDDRNGNGLGTVTVNPTLTAAAQAKADDMAAKGYFAHTSPDGRTSWSWFKDAGYSFSYAGENLAVDFTDSGDVNQAWLNSPTHRANIMNGHFTEIGIATAKGTFEGHPTIFVVQMFGTPSASPTNIAAASQPADASVTALAQSEETTVLGATAQPAQDTPKNPSRLVAPAPAAKQAARPITLSAQQPSAVKPAVSAAPAEEVPASQPVPAEPWWARLAVSPHDLLRAVYILFGLVLLSALLMRTRFEFQVHHARHAFAVLFLMVFMGGLFVTADHTVFVPPVIGEGASQ